MSPEQTVGLSARQMRVKRGFDVVVAAVALVILGWTIPILIFLARRDTRGPGLFRQARVGLGEQEFEVLKLRTMRMDSPPGRMMTSANDPRVTPLGHRLRRYKLDEFPQLLNVLRGDMSLIGPRPTVASDYERMTSRQRQRALVRPGITGLAQLNGNTAMSWPERIEHDLAYITGWSLRGDLMILVRTVSGFAAGGLHTDPEGDDEWA
jgi:lipopolysaccharide/colanic/teichoic acid biosynthesis glycosyltransferase